MKYLIGTRGSKLALAQAEYVRDKLKSFYPQDQFELQIITTKGDEIADRPLEEIGGSGLFVREIERLLLQDRIQLAVHSMKDMPGKLPEGLMLASVWAREDPRDVLVLREKKSLQELPLGAVIGTGSKRRAFQLLKQRPDIHIIGIRGNVDTRLRKMEAQNMDGIILAAAGLKRLGMEERITCYLEPEQMIPAPAQGILGLEVLKENRELQEKLSVFCDPQAQAAAEAERCFLREMGADCHLPIGAYLQPEGPNHYFFYGLFGNEDGTGIESVRLAGEDPCGLAWDAAKIIRKKSAGKVFLVGAGPGDPGLLTQRGHDAIKIADCIVYDRLASNELLNLAKPNCEVIDAGKENHHHILPQEEINSLLVRKAMKYHNVVRLKGGDPYVFGRGGEEALYLKERGIACEVIPGISSALAGLAYAGIPITHRGLSQGFHVVTAHNRNDRMADIDFSAMAHSKDTCVFLMGLRELENITRGLMEAGKPKDTPAAVISNATTDKQRCCMGTLENITEGTKNARLTSPALIVVGDVVRLREQLNFWEERPLFGRRFLVAETIPLWECPKAGMDKDSITQKSLGGMLREHGARTDRVITGRIVRIPLCMKAEDLDGFEWIVFTSRNAVRAFFENLWDSGLDVRSLGRVQFACIGKATAKVLADYQIQADYCAKTANGNAFGRELREIFHSGTKVLYPQNKAKDHALTELITDHCRLTELAVYENMETEECRNLSGEQLLEYDGICLTNALSARRLLSSCTEALRQQLNEKSCVYVIGPATAKQVKELGITNVWQAEQAGYESIFRSICQNSKNKIYL